MAPDVRKPSLENLPEVYRPTSAELRGLFGQMSKHQRYSSDTELPWTLGGDVARAAIRLYPHHQSTDRSPWVVGKAVPQQPTFIPIRPGQGIEASWFIDTLELECRVPAVATEGVDGLVAKFPAGDIGCTITRALQSIVGGKSPTLRGRVMSDYDPANGTGIQRFVFSTCDLDPYTVYHLARRICQGEICLETPYGTFAVGFVRLDLTCNVAGAVAPSKDGGLLQELLGWEYKDNGRYVGDCCHTYIVRVDNEGHTLLEVKAYDKLRYMLEKSSIESDIGNSLRYFLESPQVNIAAALRSPDVHAKGFGRMESRWFSHLPPLEDALEQHEGMATALSRAHCVETPLHQSVELLLPNWKAHSQIVLAVALGGGLWDVALVRWANRKTNSGCGEVLEKVPESRLLHLLRFQTIGEQAITLYVGEYAKDKHGRVEIRLLLEGVVPPDPKAKGQLHYIEPSTTSRRKYANTGRDWLEAGFDLPLLCGNRNGHPRNLRIGQEKPILPDTTLSVEAMATRKRNLASKRAKREGDAKAKWAAKVEADRLATPSGRIHSVSELAKVSKTPCTRLYPEPGTGWYFLLVGKKWYRADSRLQMRLEERLPAVPFRAEYSPAGEGYWLFIPQ